MGRIKVCNFGRIMLKIFCWTTVILAIYLILGITGCYEKWFGGPAGIVKSTSLLAYPGRDRNSCGKHNILDRNYYSVCDI